MLNTYEISDAGKTVTEIDTAWTRESLYSMLFGNGEPSDPEFFSLEEPMAGEASLHHQTKVTEIDLGDLFDKADQSN